jgi:hypothetical protein
MNVKDAAIKMFKDSPSNMKAASTTFVIDALERKFGRPKLGFEARTTCKTRPVL